MIGPATFTNETVVSDELPAPAGSIAAAFVLHQSDWTDPGQALVIRGQVSFDGVTWDDLLVCTATGPAPGPDLPYSYSSAAGMPAAGFIRLVCEVTGSITFAIEALGVS